MKKPLRGIVIRGARKHAEREAAVDLMSKIFVQGDYFTSRENAAHLLKNEKRYIRVAVRNKEVVGHVGIWPVTVRVGEARLKTAGISGVCTRPDLRKNGLATALMKDSIVTAQENGFHISMLFGIPDFYHNLGYAPCMDISRIELDITPALKLRSPLSVRNYRKSDLPALKALYAEEAGRVVGMVDRKDADWKRILNGRYTVRVATSRAGDLKGYYLRGPWQRKDDALWEICSKPEISSYKALTKDYGQYQDENKRQRGTVFTPIDRPLGIFVRYLGSTVRLHQPQNGGSMVRIINLKTTMKAMLPEFNARLKRSLIADETASLAIETDMGSVSLAVVNGKARIQKKASPGGPVARIPQSVLSSLLFGFFDTEYARLQKGVRMPGKSCALLEALFPVSRPYMSEPDHF
ncbi:enhanced intracellular survival protein Eis [Candidatus Hydrogenedentota bacterium]